MTDMVIHPPLVGIVGYARVGKDTVAAMLENVGYTRIGFADALKEVALFANPIVGTTRWLRKPIYLADIVEKHGWEWAKDNYPEVRQVLKGIGTGCRNHVDSDIWIDAVLQNYPDYTVIPDVRFHNEASAIKAAHVDAVLIRVNRPGWGAESVFESEVPEIDVDFEIDNDGSLDELAEALDDVIFQWSVNRNDDGSELTDWTERSGGIGMSSSVDGHASSWQPHADHQPSAAETRLGIPDPLDVNNINFKRIGW